MYIFIQTNNLIKIVIKKNPYLNRSSKRKFHASILLFFFFSKLVVSKFSVLMSLKKKMSKNDVKTMRLSI